MICPSCDAVLINGIYCHEHGCPDAWRTSTPECKNCGFFFEPHSNSNIFCCEECYNDYYCIVPGESDDCED